MTKTELDILWQKAMRESIEDGEMFTRYHFANLVADKARQDLREEIIYTWVPPSFVDFAIKTEREACAELCIEHGKVWGERMLLGFQATLNDAAEAIRARGGHEAE